MILTDSEKYTPAETHEQHTQSKSKLPLILGLSIGGGVLLLGIIIYLFVKDPLHVFSNSGGDSGSNSGGDSEGNSGGNSEGNSGV